MKVRVLGSKFMPASAYVVGTHVYIPEINTFGVIKTALCSACVVEDKDGKLHACRHKDIEPDVSTPEGIMSNEIIN